MYIIVPFQGFQVLELRNPPRDRIVQFKISLLIEHQCSHSSNWFGQRGETEDAIVLDRTAYRQIEFSVAALVNNLTVASDQRCQTGDLALIYKGLHGFIQVAQELRRHSYFFGQDKFQD